MDLSNDDVAEILALLDSLPYDELDVETPRALAMPILSAVVSARSSCSLA